MKSKTRKDCEAAEALFAGMLMSYQDYIKSPRMLVVGTAGNPLTHNGKPGLDNPHFFSRYIIETLDFDPKWSPNIVGDITKPEKWIIEPYDLIHMTQTIEHIPNIFDLPHALKLCLYKDGYVIIDCPWGPNSPDYHGEAGSFGDYWRISKDGMRYLFKKHFHIVDIIDTDANTSCLMRVL
jgi:hypothetical protein